MPVPQRKNGNFIQADFFDHLQGLNITDSPFKVAYTQAVDGYNYDYIATGGLRKRNGHTGLNSGADAQTYTLGFALQATSTNTKTVLRAAGTKLQTLNTTTGATTNVTDDTVSASTTPFTSTQPVVAAQFNTTSLNGVWLAGGGQASGSVLGYTGNTFTVNGSSSPTGSFSASTSTTGGSLPATTTFYYALALHKLSTGAISNAALDLSIKTGAGATNTVTLSFASLGAIDTTKYDLIYIYRSAAAGSSGFTTGDLAGTAASSATSFLDTGTVQGTALAVPRTNNVLLDNGVLPAGTYKTITVFKRRLVTAQGSTIYLSDLNKPESWPGTNVITVPSGGDITALAIISFSTPTTSATDEFLCIFKERELWILTGSSSTDWTLKFIDYAGCPAQPLCVFANGFLFFMDYRGAYLWDGSNKPIYISRPIEYDWGPSGDLDLSNLTLGCASFFRKQNEIVWVLPSISLGAQKLMLKLDLRLSLPNVLASTAGRTMDGVFIKDSLTQPIYACQSFLVGAQEVFYAGDNAGNTYKLFDNVNSDAGSAIAFRHRSRPEDFGLISTTKRYHKIVAWCRESTTTNLTLKYWVSYRTDTINFATQAVQITSRPTVAFWDQVNFDQAYFDQNLNTYTPVVFNLGNSGIGVEGDALTVEFQQQDLNAPVTIAGYSVLYTEQGLRKGS